MLKMRNRKYRALTEAEERDEDLDGIPDIYEQDNPAYHLRMAKIYEEKAAEHRRRAEAVALAAHEPAREPADEAADEPAGGSSTGADRPA